MISEPEEAERSIVRGSPWPLVIALVGWVTIAGWGATRYRPPPPLPANAPADEFSAARAMQILRDVLGDETPHPAGSEANDAVRERILTLVREWGYQPELQITENHIYRDPQRPLVPLENILFRRAGQGGPSGAIALVAHYDSSPAGPGASDDGVGMSAILEIARMLADEPPPIRDVLFLITDGEEYGLLGADRWVPEHPWAKEIAVAINLEARGTTGGSLMFETSPDDRWLIRHFARVVDRPLTTSVFYEVYKYLPNDTDFTILKQAGMEGYNFAFIGEVRKYHTEEDRIANVDQGSLQHHGQNALALVRALANSEDLQRSPGQAVYFDFFAWFVIHWPVAWSYVLAAVAFVLLALPIRHGSSAVRWVGWRAGCVAIGVPLAACLASAFVGHALQWDPRLELSWLEQPLPCALAAWFAALALAAVAAGVIPATLRETITAVGWGGCLVAILCTLWLPGASYLFLIPALGCGVARFLVSWTRPFVAILVVAWVGGILWIPLERLFYDALGFGDPTVIAVRIGWIFSFLIPALVWARRWRWETAGVATAGFIGTVLWALAANP